LAKKEGAGIFKFLIIKWKNGKGFKIS